MIRIITDSTSDLTPEQAEKLGVTVLPIEIRFGEEVFTDGVDMTNEEFFAKLEAAETLPTTSQIPPAVFEEIFNKILADGDEILCLLISSKLSGTMQSARIAAQMTGSDKIYVPDTKTVTVGLGLLISVICGMRDRGMSASELAQQVETLSNRVRIVAAVSTLKYLKMGGRLSGAAAVIGGMLGICPIVLVEDGAVNSAGKARGMHAAIGVIEEKLKQDGYRPDRSLPIAFGHTCAPDRLQSIMDKLSYVGDCAFVTDIGSVVGTHAGPGAAGIAYFAEE